MQARISEAQDREIERRIRRGVWESTNGDIRKLPHKRLLIKIEGIDGLLIGGARLVLLYRWLNIKSIWVTDAARRCGNGTLLLKEIENIALNEDCLGVQLQVSSFESPEFFRKRGYKQVGILADLPPGYKQYWLAKSFIAVPPSGQGPRRRWRMTLLEAFDEAAETQGERQGAAPASARS